jgi:hypothetical protein
VKKKPTNIGASVRARLLNLAKADDRPFQEVLQYYAMERFLYRLSRSEHAGRFVLKGALMLQFWGGPVTRSTKDIDLLGETTISVDDLVALMRACCDVEVEDDGITFDAESMTGEEIRLDAIYDGVRVRGLATLAGARATFQVDVGFGDVITPGAVTVSYPTLLEFDAPKLLGYTPETVVAEKLQAMVALDMANTRLKAEAIRATFERRRTPLPDTTPIGLTPAFHSADAKQAQWIAYTRKARVQGVMPSLDEVAEHIAAFVMPALTALVAGEQFDRRWSAGGPWE